MEGTSSDRRVLISIDDTALLQPSNDVGRAHSLNRLDDVGNDAGTDDDDLQRYAIYKCPSFPRLPGRLTPDARTFSTTHVETDSLSPRVSSENLNFDWDKDRLGGAVTLVRSVSARAMDNFPQLDHSQASQGHYLTPHEGQTCLVNRSTSCPMMASSVTHSQSVASSLSPGSNRAQQGTSTAVSKDTAERFSEKPSKPSTGTDPLDGISRDESKPQSPRRECLASPRHTAANRREKNKSGFMNIGDIPTPIAQRVIADKHGLGSLPATDRNVKAKCLQWLNSLDQDTDTESDVF